MKGGKTMEIRKIQPSDKEFWLSLDRHLGDEGFDRKVRDGMGYVLLKDGVPSGVLRYSLFWDNTPFCNLLYIAEACQGTGCGRALMVRWEEDMKTLGYGMVMTSTQVDESAQHFYRKLGYRDAGGFVVHVPGYEQPMELIMIKGL